MSDHPILFKGHLVRANHAGLKSVTRRLSGLQKINEDPDAWELLFCGRPLDGKKRWSAGFCQKHTGEQLVVPSRFGGAGDTIWTRETHAFMWPEHCDNGLIYGEDGPSYDVGRPIRDEECTVVYRADTGDKRPGGWPDEDDAPSWKPSIHMPRWASRDKYKNISVRCERLHEITADDVLAEGIKKRARSAAYPWHVYAVEDFRSEWDEINAARGYPWEKNPWCWRVEYLNPVAVQKGNQKGAR